MTTSRATASAPTASGGGDLSQSALAPDDAVDAAGVPAWFAPFYREYYPVLVQTGMALSRGDRNVTDDAISKVMERQIRSRRWDHIEHHLSYFKKAVVRQIYSEYKKTNKMRRREVAESEGTSDRPDPRSTNELNFWEDSEWVESVLSGLPARQRQVMTVFCEVLDSKEVAEILGASPETIRSNIRHVRKKLQKHFPSQAHPSLSQTSARAGEETTK